MEAQFDCKRCRTRLSIPVGKLGKKVLCPVCEHVVTVMRSSDILEPEEAILSSSTSAASNPNRPRSDNTGRETNPFAPATQPSAPNRGSNPPIVRPREEPPPETKGVGCGPIVAVALIFLALMTVLMVGNLAWFNQRPIRWDFVEGDRFSIVLPDNHRLLPKNQGFVARHRNVRFRIQFEEIDPAELKKVGGVENLFKMRVDDLRNNPRPMNIDRQFDVQLKGGHEGHEVRFSSVRFTRIVRFYLVGDRLYTLEARGSRLRPDSGLVQKVFDSFEIHKK